MKQPKQRKTDPMNPTRLVQSATTKALAVRSKKKQKNKQARKARKKNR